MTRRLVEYEMNTLRLTGVRFDYHDQWKKVAINGYTIPLTPTEYRLCALFFRQGQQHWETDEGVTIVSYASRRTLQTEAGVPNTQLLRKHMSNANAKLIPFGVQIMAFLAGYILLVKP